MRSGTHEVIASNMIRPFRPQPHTGTLIQPQSSPGSLLLRHFQPLPPPDPLHPILAHWPACTPQQCRDPPVAVAPVLRRQGNDRSGEAIFVQHRIRLVSLCPSPLPQQPAAMPFRQPVLLPRTLYRTTPPLRAYKFPCATSRKTCFSRESSATNRLSREFSFSSSFSRFAWSSFSPPNSFRQRYYVCTVS